MSTEVMEGQVVHLETTKGTQDPPIENVKDVLLINQPPKVENDVNEGLFSFKIIFLIIIIETVICTLFID